MQSSDEMNVLEVEAFKEGKTLFRRTRVENWTAAGISGRPATFSSWPATFLLSNTKNWPVALLSAIKMAGHAQCMPLALFYPPRESFKHFRATDVSKASISLCLGCVPVPRSSEVHFALLSLVYRVVVLLIKLFVERTRFVFLSHCSLFKQSLFKSCLFALSTLLYFAY